jgi:large-conductance mechanosensitive channel
LITIHPQENNLIHPTSSVSNVHVADALKITKCHRRSKFDLTHIDFNNMVIEVVNYLLTAFVGGILFILALLDLEILGALWQVNGWHEQDL